MMPHISWFVLKPGKLPTYRNLRSWVHFCLIAVSGFLNLFYVGISQIFRKAMDDLDAQGFSTFFQGADPIVILPVIPAGILHAAIAVGGIVVGLASLDALKNRLLDYDITKPD